MNVAKPLSLFVSVCLLAVVSAAPASAQTSTKVSDRELIEVLSGRAHDLPVLFVALTELRPSYSVSGAQVRRVLAGTGVDLGGFVGDMLEGCSGLQISGSDLSIRYTKARRIHMTDEHGKSLGYAHLDTRITAKVRNSGRALESVRGLQVSKKEDSFRVNLQKVTISQSSITIKAGKLGVTLLKETFDLGTSASASTTGVSEALPKG